MHKNKLRQKPFFTTQEAKLLGISSRMLSYYVNKEELERISRGVYRFTEYQPSNEQLQWEGLAVAASNIKEGVICLLSALSYYELTDEFVNEFWIAIPNRRTRVQFPMTRIVRLRNMTLGVESRKIAGMSVKIFNVERTIVESFRLLDIETAVVALKNYMSGSQGKPNIKKLLSYGKALRIDISRYIVSFAI